MSTGQKEVMSKFNKAIKQILESSRDNLRKYVFDEDGARFISNDDIKNLIHDGYGNKEPQVLYRGLNFKTEEQYNDFLKTISSGPVVLKSPTSWSEDKETADSFSKSPKSYNLGMLGQEFFGSYDRMDDVQGYGGVTIMTKIEPNEGLDVNEALEGGAETETILPIGTYTISLAQEHTPRSRRLNTPNVDTLSDEDIQYLVIRKPEVVTQELFNQIVTKQTRDPKINVNTREVEDYDRKTHDTITVTSFRITSNMPNILRHPIASKFTLPDNIQEPLVEESDRSLKEFHDKFFDTPMIEGQNIIFEISPNDGVFRYAVDENNYEKRIKGRLGALYHQFNDREFTRKYLSNHTQSDLARDMEWIMGVIDRVGKMFV